jgi:hypothetical protein
MVSPISEVPYAAIEIKVPLTLQRLKTPQLQDQTKCPLGYPAHAAARPSKTVF